MGSAVAIRDTCCRSSCPLLQFSLFLEGVLLIDSFSPYIVAFDIIASVDVFDGALAEQGESMLTLTDPRVKTPLR